MQLYYSHIADFKVDTLSGFKCRDFFDPLLIEPYPGIMIRRSVMGFLSLVGLFVRMFYPLVQNRPGFGLQGLNRWNAA